MISAEDILRQYWGYDSFRPMQRDIIMAAVEQHDALALLPTGGGKSVCFQVPVLMQDGVGVVISPLIALMQDQVEQLNRRDIPAAAVYSGMRLADIDRVLDEAVSGKIRFLYVSPERIHTRLFIERFKQMNVSLIAVDEAHCISQWGYDFRPAYLRIPEIRLWKPEVPVLALTATATPKVVEDISQKLHFRRPLVFRKSFVRANLSYVNRPAADKLAETIHILAHVSGSSVVYARSRAKVERFAVLLQQKGISASCYHAGLEASERARRQEEWISGHIRVMVCTNAFGMGIDKPDVRTVIHIDPPESLEAYFQEAGRAGRDEKKAWAIFLIQPADISELTRKKEEGFPGLQQIAAVYQSICSINRVAEHDFPNQPFPVDPEGLAAHAGVSPFLISSCFTFLEHAGLLSYAENGHQFSTLYACAMRDDLFRFMDSHEKLREPIQYVLRMCSGIFEHPVRIQEHRLAAGCGMPQQAFVDLLNTLHQLDLFSYQPASSLPECTFLAPRMDTDRLPVSARYVNERYTDFSQKLQAVIDYLENNAVCRTRFLVGYFGEQLDTECGVCDVCISRKSSSRNLNRFDHLCQLIKDKAQSGQTDLSAILRIPDYAVTEIREAVDLLLEADVIFVNSENRLQCKEKK